MNLAPITKEPQRILDIGTGTGIWAIEMGMSSAPSNVEYSPIDRNRNLTVSISTGDRYPNADVRDCKPRGHSHEDKQL